MAKKQAGITGELNKKAKKPGAVDVTDFTFVPTGNATDLDAGHELMVEAARQWSKSRPRQTFHIDYEALDRMDDALTSGAPLTNPMVDGKQGTGQLFRDTQGPATMTALMKAFPGLTRDRSALTIVLIDTDSMAGKTAKLPLNPGKPKV